MTDDLTVNSDLLPQFAKKVNIELKHLLSKHAVNGPVCHVGSLINKEGVTETTAQKWRSNFGGLDNSEFVGMDIFAGVNVDVVVDLHDPRMLNTHPQYESYFGLMFASALCEHVKQPDVVAKNMVRMMRPGAHMYFSGPWVWGYHPYPDDYWRISISGFEVLFPELEVVQWWYSGTTSNVGIEVTDRKYERKLFTQHTVTGPAAIITDRGMPYLNVGIIARKP